MDLGEEGLQDLMRREERERQARQLQDRLHHRNAVAALSSQDSWGADEASQEESVGDRGSQQVGGTMVHAEKEQAFSLE